MATPFSFLVKDGLAAWMRARGLWILASVALVPPLLTGAWVWTHQTDVAATGITWEPDDLEQGDLMNVTATIENIRDSVAGPFNVTVRIGFYEQSVAGQTNFRARTTETFLVESLEPGGERDFELNWTTESGTWLIETQVDPDDEVQEIEELNNVRQAQVQVRFPRLPVDLPAPATTDANATGLKPTDLVLGDIRWEPADVYQEDQANITVDVTNRGPSNVTGATVRFNVHRAQLTGYSPLPSPALSELVTLEPNETMNVTFEWTPRQIGQYLWAVSVDATGVARDTDDSNNAAFQQIFIDRELVFEEPDPKATAKDFFRNVLELLHLTLLIPLVALFYAGGLIEDEREKGNLAYLLTRPVPRWTLPVARFVVGLVIAGAALAVGLLLTYLLLLGLPQDAPGYFYWPLVFTLLALVIYSAVFTLLGVVTHRPYMWGLLYVIGFEALILLGRNVLVNGRPLLQDWVLYASLNHWVQKAFNGWDPTIDVQYLPEGSTAMIAFVGILALAGVSIVGSAWWMQRREFEV